MSKIELKHVDKYYGKNHILKDVNLTIEDGDFMTLLGPSGCGKSVTLKCIAGIMTPDRGRIVLNGRVLFDSEKRTDLTPQQRRVGYLFQQYALFPNMTVEQNTLCGIRAGSRSEKRALAAEKLRMFRLEGLEKKYPAQLSGGQQQRVALARILCSEPQAILLDEPFAGVDPIAVEELIIPEQFDETYSQYLELQASQGFELTDYCGKRVKRYTYEITNYPTGESGIQAGLLVYKSTVIGGDVLSAQLGGFIHGLEMPA